LPHQPITAVLRHRWEVDALLFKLSKAAAQSRKTLAVSLLNASFDFYRNYYIYRSYPFLTYRKSKPDR
jgi:hypothetical protein